MNDEPDDSKNSGKILSDYAPYIGLGLQLAVTVVIMVFIGVWLDGEFDTKPALTIICSFIGVFAALYNFIKTVIKLGK
jgi:ATP synthase protein I